MVPKLFFLSATLFIVACSNNHSDSSEIELLKKGLDSIKFGNIRPLLEKNTPGEIIQRIDSVSSKDSMRKSYEVIYYITDKGAREMVWEYKQKLDSTDPHITLITCNSKEGDNGHLLTYIKNDGTSKTWAQDSAHTLVITVATHP